MFGPPCSFEVALDCGDSEAKRPKHFALADENTSHRFVSACRRLARDFPVIHIARWQDGSWLGLDDAALLISGAEAGRVLVAFDRATLPWHAGQVGWTLFTALFQQGVGTRQGRSAHPASLTHNRPLVLRNACGSHRRPGLRAIAPRPFSCQDGVLRRQAQAAAPVARSHALRDVRRRSPAARSSSRHGDPQGRRAPSPRRSQREPSLQKSALTA